MSVSEKNELLDKLSISYNRANYLKIKAEEKKQPDTAAKFERKKNKLKIKIDRLLRDLYANWIGDVAQLTAKLTDVNEDLSKCIADIEKDIKFAENVVKALGYIDDVIKIASDLVP